MTDTLFVFSFVKVNQRPKRIDRFSIYSLDGEENNLLHVN